MISLWLRFIFALLLAAFLVLWPMFEEVSTYSLLTALVLVAHLLSSELERFTALSFLRSKRHVCR
jgi:hypothetical protein